MSSLLLSICIPTRGRSEILEKTINSIFSSKVNFSEFEVVIYDSSDINDQIDTLPDFCNYPNLTYKKGKNDGFLNLISALKMGKGAFLKLHNDYSEFSSNGLNMLLNIIKNNLEEKPLIFFGNDSLTKTQNTKYYNSFDNFLYNISYFSTWSTAFGIWKIDFDDLKDVNINPMFPHTSLLLNLNIKNSYIINNDRLFFNQSVNKKGGYNLFKTFTIDYLDMLKVSLNNKHISENTFKHIKHDMFKNFLIEWYCNTKILKNEYTFILSGIKQSMRVHYSYYSYYSMIFLSYRKAFMRFIKYIVRKFFN